jgi:hypothetical protein
MTAGIVDHQTCNLNEAFGLEFMFGPSQLPE